ncbi:MAG TPA: glycosyltransferase family 1 protein [Vicinamibacterales bacterium]|nr:glycosyltransferase family 1 protein [Vicinamibacterales bacterium]
MRVVIDYRPALRERSGVGEYTHQLVSALLAVARDDAAREPLELSVFSSSWKDRLAMAPELAGAQPIDRRVPVAVLNFAWHRLGWPTAEALMGRAFDVTHSLHPLLLPSKAAAQVVTIHDLDFLAHPERTRAEIRRDYPALAREHAHRADRIVVPSHFTAREVERQLEVPAERIDVCPPGAPDWPPRAAAPEPGYLLFFGTLEPRKNVGGLLDAYERLLAREKDTGRAAAADLPPLVLAGRATEAAAPWLARIERPPLAGHVRLAGYVNPAHRRPLFEGARLLVQPSFEEGFGLPVLEAMTLGVPVVAADRGALPEVLGDAGLLVDPEDTDALAAAIARLVEDDGLASAAASKGVQRSSQFRWTRTARAVYQSYERALDHRRCASA